jgi:hypothetical protein
MLPKPPSRPEGVRTRPRPLGRVRRRRPQRMGRVPLPPSPPGRARQVRVPRLPPAIVAAPTRVTAAGPGAPTVTGPSPRPRGPGVAAGTARVPPRPRRHPPPRLPAPRCPLPAEWRKARPHPSRGCRLPLRRRRWQRCRRLGKQGSRRPQRSRSHRLRPRSRRARRSRRDQPRRRRCRPPLRLRRRLWRRRCRRPVRLGLPARREWHLPPPRRHDLSLNQGRPVRGRRGQDGFRA